jgi:hypothetical protein
MTRRTATTTRLAAAVLLAVAIGSHHSDAQAFGRLFTTPDQRLMLEEQRAARADGIDPARMAPRQAPEPVVVPPREVPSITVNGVVLRSGGSGTAWVNGENTQTGDLASMYIGAKTLRDGRVRIETPADFPDVELKPGQTYQPTAGQVVDAYDAPQPAPAVP